MVDQIVLNNRYRVLGLIGEGGMAKVYKAEDRLLERTVAVKVLREQYASDDSFLTRFRQEARAAASLAHPNIVSVYDVGVDGQWNYIVMEYVQGPSLKELIVQGAPFVTSRVVDISQQILSALAFAHQKGVVHRDVKPQNILVTTDGQAKVADFGIARAAGGAQLTETGVVLGSVHYFAPEQAKGDLAIPASDIYAVGVVMYEMLTGQLPFQGENTLAIALKQVQEPVPPPTRLNPRIPPQVESIVMKAMAKDSQQRFVDADAMKRALSKYQSLGEQNTAPISIPVAKLMPPVGNIKGASLGTGQRRVDWFMITLVVLILGFLGVSVPIGNRVYELYFVPSPTATVAATATAAATPTPRPAPTATPIPRVAVPQLSGKPYSEARKELEKLDLQIRIVDEQYDDKLEALAVISQSPVPGASVQLGLVVDVVVSKGPTRVVVPNVVNDNVNAAVGKLSAVQLRAKIDEAWHDSVPQGVVFEQKPPADSRVDKGAVISLSVSRGKKPPDPTATSRPMIGVPAVIGLPEAEARAHIEAARLRNSYTNYQGKGDIPDSELVKVQVGQVLSQRPPPGMLVDPGTTVYIAVRKN
ncbi:MAG: protein kinase [Chloroflexi bacterium]|nr:protein kinase [Chloroflexota bacterium]